MVDIFLSYTEKDREQARRVAAMLEAAGWTVWWDRRIPAGETWRSVLDHALENMRCMVVLWTARSIESEWVYEEASEGRRQDKLVPVMLEAVRPPAGFREIQAADLSGWDGSADNEAWRMLLDDLTHLLGPPGDARAAPAPRPDTGTPAYDPADLRRATAMPGRPPRRVLAWALAVLLPLAVGAAYLGLKAPHPARDNQPAVVSPKPPDGPLSSIPATPPKSPEAVAPSPPGEPDQTVPVERPPKKFPAATASAVAQAKPVAATPAKRQANTRCADLLTRIQLGESLADEAQSFLQKECRQ